jgi:hypothetical protein
VAVGGSTAQALVKASGADYDTAWATIVPGDRYLTTSTTSLTINNGNKTLTVGTGLSYSTTQNVTIAYDASHHMHGEVLTYNSGTGVMTVDVNHNTGSGTYAAWVVNVGGVTPVTSTTWGSITGTLSSQVDLQGSLDAKLATANNLSELTATASTARTNLGLGTAAVEPATKLVPSGGTTGQVLSKVSATSWDLQWATAGGGGGIDVQEFGTSAPGSFTWTKPANAKVVHIFMWGAGGGGGAGSCNVTTNTRGGGGGGSGGTFFYTIASASQLNATETGVVGTGGNGGAASTLVNGNPGVAGSNTTFKIWKAVGGGGANGGSPVGGTAGTAKQSCVFNTLTLAGTAGGGAVGSDGTGGALLTSIHFIPAGGGGGGGQNAGAAALRNGGAGGFATFALNNAGLDVAIAGGAAGSATGPVQATAGTSAGSTYNGGTGGGGGYSRASQVGGTGAAGGWPGGGGGGGGASDTTFNSGGGGAGARGRVIVVTLT